MLQLFLILLTMVQQNEHTKYEKKKQFEINNLKEQHTCAFTLNGFLSRKSFQFLTVRSSSSSYVLGNRNG